MAFKGHFNKVMEIKCRLEWVEESVGNEKKVGVA